MNPNSPGNPVAPPKVQDLQGLWRRSLIAWPDGARDETTEVRWLQGSRAYIDLRQPALLPDFSSRRGLADLSMDDCRALARQEGFAGHFTFDGTYFEWARRIDFQPKPLYSDVGSLWWEGNVLIERGRDVDYIEHWHRDASTIVTSSAALMLRELDGNAKGALLRVGSVFMFARDRAIMPPAHKTLPECIDAAPSLADAQALIDCEISFGRVQDDAFRITASSLPYRIGDILEPEYSGRRLTTQDRGPAGAALARHWEITETEGNLRAIGVESRALKF
jgi:hypothetical protein